MLTPSSTRSSSTLDPSHEIQRPETHQTRAHPSLRTLRGRSQPVDPARRELVGRSEGSAEVTPSSLNTRSERQGVLQSVSVPSIGCTDRSTPLGEAWEPSGDSERFTEAFATLFVLACRGMRRHPLSRLISRSGWKHLPLAARVARQLAVAASCDQAVFPARVPLFCLGHGRCAVGSTGRSRCSAPALSSMSVARTRPVAHPAHAPAGRRSLPLVGGVRFL